jgi:hypothetical protein
MHGEPNAEALIFERRMLGVIACACGSLGLGSFWALLTSLHLI